MRLPSRKRLIALAVLLAALTGLGWGLYVLLPPEPIWRLDDCTHVDFRLEQKSMFLTAHQIADDTTCRGPLVLRDMHTGEAIRSFFDGAFSGHAVISSNGEWIAGWNHDKNTIHVVRVTGGAERIISLGKDETLEWSWCDLSPDGSILAAQFYGKNNDGSDRRYDIFDTATGELLASSPGFAAAQFTANGRRLIVLLSGENDQVSRLKIWDIHKGSWGLDYGPIRGAHYLMSRSVGVSLDGRSLIGTFLIDDEYETVVWDLETFQRTPMRLKHAHHWKHAVSENGRAAIFCPTRDWKSHIAVWDPHTHSWILEFDADGHGGHVLLSRDGKRLFVQTSVAGEIRTMTMLDVDTARKLWSVTEQQNPFWNNEPLPTFTDHDQTLVVYRGWNQPLHTAFLDVATGKQLASVFLAPEAAWQDALVTITPDKRAHVVDVQRVRRSAGPWLEWLQALLHLDEGYEERLVIDLEERRLRGRMRSMVENPHYLNGARRALTVPAPLGTGWTPGPVCCWDFPGHGPWRWVVGIPTALGGLIVAAAMLRERWRSKPTT